MFQRSEDQMLCMLNKKSPANAKGNMQQQCTVIH